ncbi:hypothetical protein IEQ34_026475 [Dendrobium chrysotoxum]|uniref:Uncharacterized protein n=1 Tax=Dendrobium chrysotoxum TaxID=161865 RepID=A0AAV7FMR8_DENCH|nr:hypothetical protein IEQ34_026475 [Dendrobium chrysotoxum]
MPRDGGRCKEIVCPLIIDIVSLDSDYEARSSKTHIREDVLKHIYIDRCHANKIERETSTLDIKAISLRAVKKFKKSTTYHREIQCFTQEAYEKLFDVEVKDLERQSLEEVHRKTRVDIEGLTLSQASEVSPADSGDDGIESELKKVFSSDDDVVEMT